MVYNDWCIPRACGHTACAKTDRGNMKKKNEAPLSATEGAQPVCEAGGAESGVPVCEAGGAQTQPACEAGGAESGVPACEAGKAESGVPACEAGGAESGAAQAADTAPAQAKLTKKQQFIQFLKFLGFSCSAGAIQFGSCALIYYVFMGEREHLYWIAYLVSLILSVVWNFTFNRKFTFKAANNVPLAMGLVVLYYGAFTPLSTFGADAIVAAGVNELLVTALMMVLNFITEFFWDKFVVFNAKVTDAIERGLKRVFSRKAERPQGAPENEEK